MEPKKYYNKEDDVFSITFGENKIDSTHNFPPCPICGGPMHLGRSVNEVLVYCDNYAYCGYCRRPTPQEELNDGS